jgi:hypothetical protein
MLYLLKKCKVYSTLLLTTIYALLYPHGFNYARIIPLISALNLFLVFCKLDSKFIRNFSYRFVTVAFIYISRLLA